MELDQILVLLAIVFVAGRVAAELSERLRIPAVVGEIFAGVVLGPSLLDIVPAHNETLESMAQLGVIFLLFYVGLETDLRELRRVGGTAMAVAIGGVVLPFVLGLGFMTLTGSSTEVAIFVGTAMVATSVGVTARVLRDRGQLATREARIILGAAVVDDVLALVLLAIVGGAASGTFSASQIGLLIAEAVAFFVVIGTFGRTLIRKSFPFLRRLRVTEPVLSIAIAIALVLAALSAKIGLAAIVGAFLAGIIVGETPKEEELQDRTLPLYAFFVPFFFVHVGTLVDLSSMKGSLLLTVAVTLLAIVGKLVGSGVSALKLGARSAAIIGTGMVPRGEVGILVATLGLGLGIIEESLYGVVVAMSIVTTLIAPPALALLFRMPDHFSDAGRTNRE